MHEAISEPLPVKQWGDQMGSLPRDWWPIYRPLRDVVPLANNLYDEQRENLERAKAKLAELVPTDIRAADPLTVWDESRDSFVPMWKHPSFAVALHEVQRYIGEAAQAAYDVKEFRLYRYLDVTEHELVNGNYARIMTAHVTCQSRIAFQFMPVEPDEGKDRWQAYIGVQDEERTKDLQKEAGLIRTAVRIRRGLITRAPYISVVSVERMAGRLARRSVSANNIPNDEKLATRAHRITLFTPSFDDQYRANVRSMDGFVDSDLIPTYEETQGFVLAHELGHEEREENKVGRLYSHLREAYATFDGLRDVGSVWPLSEDPLPFLARVKGGLSYSFYDLRNEIASGNWAVHDLEGDIYKPGSALFLLEGIRRGGLILSDDMIAGINPEKMLEVCSEIAVEEREILDSGDELMAMAHFQQVEDDKISLIPHDQQLASA